jgi:hypothetical protein
MKKVNNKDASSCTSGISGSGDAACSPLLKVSASDIYQKRRWLFYVVGVPTFGVIYHFIYLRLLYQVVAINDSAHPVLSPLQSAALTILNFPMMYLWFPVGEWLKPHLGDDGVVSLFSKINALVWGVLVTSLASFIIPRSKNR